MLINHIISKLTKYLNQTPTSSQKQLIKELAAFVLNDNNTDNILLVNGYAGTGKTTTLSAFVRVLNEFNLKSVLLAPTGRAAKVFAYYANKPAQTIHKKIYRQQSTKDGFGRFKLDKNLHSKTIFIIDEASMIANRKQDNAIFGSGMLLDDLIDYVNNDRNCKLILVGDTAQLPPVGMTLSPALDLEKIRHYSASAKEIILTDVVRQALQSGILENATQVRYLINENIIKPGFLLKRDYSDFKTISGEALIETISDCYDNFGIDDTIVICRSNKRANKYNEGIRNMILYREDELVAGDLLMVVKNNYFWLKDYENLDFIANGDLIEVRRIKKQIELYDFRFVHCDVKLIDYDIEIETILLLDSLSSESAALTEDENRKMFYNILEDYTHLKPKKKQYQNVRENEYFNALQVKYAYAVTCHKAQGGQWKAIFIDQGFIKEDMIDKEYLRWLYTAITRATEKVYLVNFPDFLFRSLGV